MIKADVEFVSTGAGAVRAEMATIRTEAARTYSGMSTDSLKAAIAQERYDKVLEKNAIESLAVRRATVAYREELERLNVQSGRTSRGVSRSSEHTARGHSLLSRGAVLASTALVGGYGLAYGLDAVVKAAENEQSALARVQLSLRNAGLSWGQYGGQIRGAITAQEHASGFDKADIASSLSANITRYGDVEKAIRATAVAEDVARQKGFSLAETQTMIQRATFGTAKSVKSLGINYVASTANVDKLKETTKHYTAEQLAQAKAADLASNKTTILAKIEEKYHGAAAKFLTTTAGKQALFNAELKDTEDTIGEDVLPTFNHYLGSLTKWMGKAKNQKAIQHDVNQAVHAGVGVVKALGFGFKVATGFLSPFAKLLGGFPHLFEAAFGARLLLKLAKTEGGAKLVASAMTSIGTAAVEQAVVTEAALNTETGIAEADAAKITAAANTSPLPGGGGGFVKTAEHDAEKVATGAAGGIGFRTALKGAAGGLAVLASPFLILNALQGGELDPYTDPKTGAQVTFNKAGQMIAGYPGKPHYVIAPDSAEAQAAAAYFVSKGYGKKLPPSLRPRGAQTGAPGATKGHKAVPGTSTSSGGGKNGSGSAGYVPTGSAALDLALARAQASNDQAAIRSASEAKLAYDEKAQAFAEGRIKAGKGSPSLVEQLNNIYSDESSLHSTIDSIDHAGTTSASKAKSAADRARKAAAAKKKHINEILHKAHEKRIDALTKPPVHLQLELAAAKARGASEATILKLLEQEHAALDAQVRTLVKIGAAKDRILAARTHEATIEGQIAAAKKKTGAGSSVDFAALEKQFLDTQQGILSDYADNVSTPGTQTVVHVHQHFPVAPTGDGHREAIYARQAALAAFD